MNSLLNVPHLQKVLLKNANYSESHGAISENSFLGTSILYFALAYMLPARIAVILGSGAGFVPRLIRQAQREIPDETFQETSHCLLIDANKEVHHFGTPEYYDTTDHFFRLAYPEIEIWKMTTDEACLLLKEANIRIDYLHIDADHTFAQSMKDFENYLPLMNDEFLITLHDTAVGHIEQTLDGCVPKTIATLRKEMRKGGRYAHLEMVNLNRQYKNESNPFYGKAHCCGTALIKPKSLSFWDNALFD